MALKVGKSIVRLGDKSTHGGTVLTASGRCEVNGIPAAVDGDIHQCPKHGGTPMTASAKNKSGGKALIRVGDRAACGAVITAGSLNVISA